MGQPAARAGDTVKGEDRHEIIVPGTPPAKTTVKLPFQGTITAATDATVLIEGRPAATVGSLAVNTPPHFPPFGTTFAPPPPLNKGEVSHGSATVTIGGRPAARVGDLVRTCNHPVDADTSEIASGAGTVTIG